VSFYIAFASATGKSLGEFLLWPLSCSAVVLGAVCWLRVLETRRSAADPALRPQVFLSDLLTVSLVMGGYFAIVQTWAAHLFMVFGVLGGTGLLAAMILSLLNASRRGFLRGPERAAYAVGSVAALLGLGGAALLTSMSIFALCLGEFRGFCDWLVEGVGSRGPGGGGRGVLYAGLLGFAGLAAGLVLRGWARRRRGPRDRAATR
jgi:hypothetical protein